MGQAYRNLSLNISVFSKDEPRLRTHPRPRPRPRMRRRYSERGLKMYGIVHWFRIGVRVTSSRDEGVREGNEFSRPGSEFSKGGGADGS